MELEDLFSEAGQVLEIFLPTDQSSGRTRGFAFIEFADEASVITALEKLNGHELNGRTLRVSQAEDRPQRSPSYGNQGSRSGQKPYRTSKKSKGSRRNLRARKRGG